MDPLTAIEVARNVVSSPDVIAGVSGATDIIKGVVISASASGSVPLQVVTEASASASMTVSQAVNEVTNFKSLIPSVPVSPSPSVNLPLVKEGPIYNLDDFVSSVESLLSNVSSVHHPTGYITIIERTSDFTLAMLDQIPLNEARTVVQYVTESCPSGVDLKDFIENSNFGSTVGDAKIPLDTFGADSPEYDIMDNLLKGTVVIADSVQAHLEAFQELLEFLQENLAIAEEYDGKDSIAVNTFKDQIAHCESCIEHIQEGKPLIELSSIKPLFTQHGKIPDLMDLQYIRSALIIKKAFQEKFGITGATFVKDFLKEIEKIDTIKLKYIHNKIYPFIKFTNQSDKELRGLHYIVKRTLQKIMFRMYKGPK